MEPNVIGEIMFPLTDSINSNIWLESDEDIKIDAYIGDFVPNLIISETPLEQQSLSETLKQASINFSLNDFPIDSTLELESWDSLSDEALINFEQTFGCSESWNTT